MITAPHRPGTAGTARRFRPPTTRPLTAAVLVAALGLAVAGSLTGCAGSLRSSQDSGAPQAAAEGDSGGKAAAGAAADGAGSAGAAKPAADAAASGAAAAAARIIRTADITIRVDDLAAAAQQVRQVALSLGGRVDSETTGYSVTATQKPASGSGSGSDPGTGSGAATKAPPGESLLVLRVPQARLDDALARVATVTHGTVLSRTSSSQDVTGDIADLDSRVASQRASLNRVRALMNRATSLQDVVTLESELSRRESDLEALEARLAALTDQADMSTLTVVLRTPAAKAAATPDRGFLAGLRSGWRALQASTEVVLTVLGALLPLAVAVLVLGTPVWLLLRRRARRAPGTGGGPPAAGVPTPATPAPATPAPAAPAPDAPQPAGVGPQSPGTPTTR